MNRLEKLQLLVFSAWLLGFLSIFLTSAILGVILILIGVYIYFSFIKPAKLILAKQKEEDFEIHHDCLKNNTCMEAKAINKPDTDICKDGCVWFVNKTKKHYEKF